jgi:hypothetical protein
VRERAVCALIASAFVLVAGSAFAQATAPPQGAAPEASATAPPAPSPPATSEPTPAPALPPPLPGDPGPPPATAQGGPEGTLPPEERAVVLRTAVQAAPDCATCSPPVLPDAREEREQATLVRDLDGIVLEALEDLGLRVDTTSRDESPSALTEAQLTERARTSWVFSPRIATERGHVVLRIVAVAPGSSVLLTRSERLKPEELEVRTVLMMRDLVRAGTAKTLTPVATPHADEDSVVHAARSRGRAVLALNAAVLGGFVGFSLQRAGGSDDARLTYPLIALGAGIGLGGSMIVADEWDVGTGDAWYLSAGTWWPAFGALLIGKDEPDRKKYLYGSAAAAGGLSLATVSLAFGPLTEGDALVAHSGGLFGLALGGIVDLAIQGKTDVTPTTGMGVGTITGVVLTGALARLTDAQPPSRVLFVDLSAGLGALAGAAVASPLVFGNDVTKTRNRLWLSTIALGTFVGGGVGILTTQGQSEPRNRHAALPCAPYFGIVGQSTAADGSVVLVPGGGVRGVW